MILKKCFFYTFLLLTIASCNSKSGKDKAKNKSGGPVTIDVSLAKLQEFSNAIEANGTVLANEFVELKPEISGRIVMLNIQEGRQVAEGTLLLKLFDDDLQAQLKKYESQMEIARQNEQRLKSLLSVNGLNQQEYDQALTQVHNIQADMDFTIAQIRKTEIRAPFSGTIGLRSVSKGAYVSPQDVIASLQQTGTLKIDFVMPELYASMITNGREVNVIADDPKVIFKARVIATEPQINTATRNIKVRAMLEDHSGKLQPGSFVKIILDAGSQKKAILVPTNCIIPDTRNKKIVLIKGGKARFTIVETGYRNEEKVEILSGMEQGDTFAVNGILFLKPDADVIIRNVKP